MVETSAMRRYSNAIMANRKTGRNEPCPCGSGKKYKKCCFEKDQKELRSQASPLPVGERTSARTPIPGRAEDPFADEFEDLPCPFEPEEDEWSPEESADEYAGSVSEEDEPPSYPHVKRELPELTSGQERIVDDWWDDTGPFYEKRDADEMIGRVETFLEKHPELFVQLGLQDEFLFELGAELGRRKEWRRYTDLLIRIRHEQPRMYAMSYAYYDRDIITELIFARRREFIPDYFSFFREYPDSHPDEAKGILDILAWAGLEEELMELADTIGGPMWLSSRVFGGGFVTHWLTFRAFIPHLDSRADPRAAARQVERSVEALQLRGYCVDPESIRRAIECRWTVPTEWNITNCRDPGDLLDFYHDIAWNFRGFMHDSMEFGWVKSDFLAGQLEEYWWLIPEGKRPRDTFMLKEGLLERHIVRRLMRFFWIDGVAAGGLLQAVLCFVEYLADRSIISSEEKKQIQKICTSLHRKCLKGIDSTDPLPRVTSEIVGNPWPFETPD